MSSFQSIGPPPFNPAVCSTGLYHALLPLSNFPPAESFCSSHYTIPGTTVISYALTTPNVAFRGKQRRDPHQTTPCTTTATLAKATPTATPLLASLFSQLEKAEASFLSTACHCIETTPTVTITSTTVCAATNPADAIDSITATSASGQVEAFYYSSIVPNPSFNTAVLTTVVSGQEACETVLMDSTQQYESAIAQYYEDSGECVVYNGDLCLVPTDGDEMALYVATSVCSDGETYAKGCPVPRA